MNDFTPIIPTEDFWSRRQNVQAYSFDMAPFGIPAKISANEPEILAAAQLSAGRFSQAVNQTAVRPIHIQIAVDSESRRPLSSDLQPHLRYAGLGEWITLSVGEWGYGFANLETRTACLFLSSTLATRIHFISRYFLDHYLLNFIMTEWAMLHASSVLDSSGERLIVMVASHNVGKSTTALRLVRQGFNFLADGMLLLQGGASGLVFGGYPTGEIKLRDDVLALFSDDYKGKPEQVRQERKTVVDLRAAHPAYVCETLISPAAVNLCFLERGPGVSSEITAIAADEARLSLTPNTLFWDEAARLNHNSATLYNLIRVASLYRLTIGTDVTNIVAAINELT